MKIDPALIKHQINNLLVQYPELADDEQLRADMIEGETELHEFLRDLELMRRNTVALIDGLTEAMSIFGLRQKRFEGREQAMRQLMFKLMEIADLKKLELPEATLSIRNGTPKVIVTDEQKLPDNLFRIKREPDKIKIKEFLQTGANLVGAELSNAEPTLSIRTK